MMNLIDYRTGEVIREASIAEAIESITASDGAGSAGVIEVDGLACYVDATYREIADEMRAAGVDDSETFGREVAS